MYLSKVCAGKVDNAKGEIVLNLEGVTAGASVTANVIVSPAEA
jgi:hypothetical protein